MQRAAGAVTGELGEVERLGDDALAGDGGVTVDEQREDFGARLGVAADALAGAGFAFDDGIYDLEVGRIGGETDFDLGAGSGRQDGFVTEVVFHVAITGDRVG